MGSIKRANAEHAIPSKLTNKSRRRKDIADVIYSWDFLYKPQNREVATLKNAEVVYVDPDLRDYYRRVTPGVVAIKHENKKKGCIFFWLNYIFSPNEKDFMEQQQHGFNDLTPRVGSYRF